MVYSILHFLSFSSLALYHDSWSVCFFQCWSSIAVYNEYITWAVNLHIRFFFLLAAISIPQVTKLWIQRSQHQQKKPSTIFANLFAFDSLFMCAQFGLDRFSWSYIYVYARICAKESYPIGVLVLNLFLDTHMRDEVEYPFNFSVKLHLI